MSFDNPALQSQMAAWRHELHAHPELGLREHRTSDFVADILARHGLAVDRGLAGTGVVGTVRGRRGGSRAIGLRADMDALPIQEANRFDHASGNAGTMHACGHDGHTAMLLGAACALAEAPDFEGMVHFIFQPAEEGDGGARKMIEQGLFEKFPVEAVFGLHNWPELPAGTIAVHSGPVMAACDFFTLTIGGHGGHAAMPHRTVDPVLVAGHIVTAAQSLISRNTDPFDSAVVSITGLGTDSTFNVIPNQARLWGTIRSFSPATRQNLHTRFARLAKSIADGFEATAELEIDLRAPPTVNHPAQAENAARAAALVVGAAQVLRDRPPSMTAEDFGDMLAAVPGAYIWLGQGGGPSSSPLHHPSYDFNDGVLPIGAGYWLALVKIILGGQE